MKSNDFVMHKNCIDQGTVLELRDDRVKVHWTIVWTGAIWRKVDRTSWVMQKSVSVIDNLMTSTNLYPEPIGR